MRAPAKPGFLLARDLVFAELVFFLQQLKLSIEESHSTNDGYAKGGGEKHFVEHLFLLVSGVGLGRIVEFCSYCYKNEWGDNRPQKSNTP